MRTVLALHFLALLLLTIAAFAQDPAAISAAEAACGPSNVKFDVKDDDSRHTIAQPETGKALVYVLQDMGIANCPGGCITTKVALDGAWIGANHRSSYLYVAVDPGEHHLCANWQSHFASRSEVVGLAHFTAEAGKIYYFRTRVLGIAATTFFDVEPLDSDQARLFIASFPLSVSHPKK
jgi:hypothetical protein